MRLAVIAAALALAGCTTSPAFTPRLSEPRLAVVNEADLTEAQRDMLASRSNLNIYRTLANHVDLYNRWSPLGQFLLNGSSISARHREMAMLRMGWLCQSPYEWSQHARIAKASAGMTEPEIRAIAADPNSPLWSETDRAVLKMADELRYETMVSHETWLELQKTYSPTQILELIYTSAQYQLVSMALNTLGIQVEPEAVDFMPKDLPLPAIATRPTTPRPTAPRMTPRAQATWTAEERALITPQLRPNGEALNLYTTLLNHPKLYGPRARFGSYLQRDSLLDPVTRELAIMRTAWNIRASYEWAHHEESARSAGLTPEQIAAIATGPTAKVWTPKQAAVLTAADELRREAFISNTTWAELAKHYSVKERIEIVYTIGGYTMTGLAINSLGIQTEPGYPALPN